MKQCGNIAIFVKKVKMPTIARLKHTCPMMNLNTSYRLLLISKRILAKILSVPFVYFHKLEDNFYKPITEISAARIE